MGRAFLQIYVAIGIFVIVLSLITTAINGTAKHLLSNNDWLIFIIACGALSISEALEGSK